MMNANEKNVLEIMTSTKWNHYGEVLATFSPDMEMKLSILKELEKTNSIKQSITKFKQTNNSICYCNKTGQPLGLFFESDSLHTSIATQWTLTGEKHLKSHSENTPLAYTVYLVGKMLATQKTDTLEAVEKQIKLKIDCFENLFSRGNDRTIALVQTALRVVNDPDLVTNESKVKFCRALELGQKYVIDFMHNWAAFVLRVTYGQEMPDVNTIDDFENLEDWIFNKEKNLAIIRNQKVASLKLSKDKAFLYVGVQAKAKQARDAKRKAKQAKTSKVSGLLGDIFANVNAEKEKVN